MPEMSTSEIKFRQFCRQHPRIVKAVLIAMLPSAFLLMANTGCSEPNSGCAHPVTYTTQSDGTTTGSCTELQPYYNH